MTPRQHNSLSALLLAAMASLTATAFHYAHVLKLEKVRAPRTASIPAALREPDTPPTPSVHSVSAALPQDSRSTTDRQPVSEAEERIAKAEAGAAAIARDHLARLRDPQARVQRMRQIADDVRMDLALLMFSIGASPAEAMPILGFSQTELDHFVEAATEKTFQAQQRELECDASPPCEDNDRGFSVPAEWRIRALLGPEQNSRLEGYTLLEKDRGVVEMLREQLPTGVTLADQTARDLAKALAEERERFTQIARQNGEKTGIFRQYAGVTLLTAAKPGSRDESAQLQASASAYVQHVIERASAILSGAALERFREMWEVRLETYKEDFREKEFVEAARRSAGKPATSD